MCLIHFYAVVYPDVLQAAAAGCSPENHHHRITTFREKSEKPPRPGGLLIGSSISRYQKKCPQIMSSVSILAFYGIVLVGWAPTALSFVFPDSCGKAVHQHIITLFFQPASVRQFVSALLLNYHASSRGIS